MCVNFEDGFFIHPDTFDDLKDNKEEEEDRAQAFLNQQEHEEKLPVVLQIDSIGRDGIFKIKFNQKLLVPELISSRFPYLV